MIAKGTQVRHPKYRIDGKTQGSPWWTVVSVADRNDRPGKVTFHDVTLHDPETGRTCTIPVVLTDLEVKMTR